MSIPVLVARRRAIGGLVDAIGPREIAAGVEPADRTGKAAPLARGLAHDVSILFGVGRHLGSQSRAKTSMTIMCAPQRGHGHGNTHGVSGTFFSRSTCSRNVPDVFITYQRKSRMCGYFSPDRFAGRVGKFGKQHELALNPDGFIGKTDEQVCQTLVHEMAHVWQHAFGKPGSRAYHNKEWAAKMESIGLMPSSTGMVGGKRTGQRMSDYIIPGGLFSQVFAKLAASGW